MHRGVMHFGQPRQFSINLRRANKSNAAVNRA